MAGNLRYLDNFCVPVDVDRLQNDKLKLVPFESDFTKHSKVYAEQTLARPEILQYIPYGPWPDQAAFEAWYNGYIRVQQDLCWFAIILHECTMTKKTFRVAESGNNSASSETEVVKVEEGTMAGITGLCRADPDNSCVEIGHVLTFPAFHGTFVTATAHGLLLQHLLNPAPDLHFRRVQWQANARNEASRRTALRLGFSLEGIIRWQRALIEGKPSEHRSDRETLDRSLCAELPHKAPTGTQLAGGRHTAMFSFCWDDWLDGGKDKLEQLMARYN